MEKILALAYELKSLIDEDERSISLNNLEKIMNEDKLAMAMSYKKNMAIDSYEFALSHFSKDSIEVEKAQQELHLAKKALDEVPSVRDYLSAYSKVRDLYMEINNILFSCLNENRCNNK